MLKGQKEPKIRKLYKPSDEEYKRLQYVYERKTQMGDKRMEFENGNKGLPWEECEMRWNSYRLPKDADDWRSDIYIPITSSVIEAQLSEIINQDLMPWAIERGAEDKSKAMVTNAILEYTWDVAKSDLALYEIIKDALIFGTGIGMEYYWKEQRDIKTSDGKTKRVTEFDNCYLEPVRLWDFYIDERARSFSGPNGAKDCIRRYIMDYDDFRNFFQGKTWDPHNNASLIKPGGDTNYYEFYKPPERMIHDREVEVLWYWNKPLDMLDIVANDVMVKHGPNPFKHKQLPFIRAIDVKRPYQFYGKGEPELLESLQDEVNTLRRMIIDRNHLDIDKPIMVSDTLTLEDDDTISRPHGIIPVGDVNAAKPLEYSDIPLSTFKTLEMLNDDKIRVTGMDERQMSVQKAGTATEAAILREATLKRLNLKIWHIKNDTLVDIGRLRVANILQYYAQPRLEKIVGQEMTDRAKEEGTLVTQNGENFKEGYRNIRLKDQAIGINPETKEPEELPAKGFTFFEAKPEFFLPTHGGYDIRYKASSSMPISKPLEQQKADEMYDRLAANPSIDPWKLAKYLIDSREQNPDDFKLEAPGEQKPKGLQLKQMIDLAGMENDEMAKGNPISPTPYASPAHTEIHIQYMKSDKFKEDVPTGDKKILQNFSNHVAGEIAAQQARGGGLTELRGEEGSPQAPGVPQAPGAPSEATGNVIPGKIQGGGEVPSGMPGAKAGIAGGRKI